MVFRDPASHQPDPEFRTCEACRALTLQGNSYFDTAGRVLCQRCFQAGEVAAADRRVEQGKHLGAAILDTAGNAFEKIGASSALPSGPQPPALRAQQHPPPYPYPYPSQSAGPCPYPSQSAGPYPYPSQSVGPYPYPSQYAGPSPYHYPHPSSPYPGPHPHPYPFPVAEPLPPPPPTRGQLTAAAILCSLALVSVAITCAVASNERASGLAVGVLAVCTIGCGVGAAVSGLSFHSASRRAGEHHRAGLGWGILGMVAAIATPFIWVVWSTFIAVHESTGGGGSWSWPLPGRPLRLRGKSVRARLQKGSDWTRGGRPDVTGLDAPTRAALEAVWLRDAQIEHASVPAFARISWQLAAIGAPAELLEGAQQAGLDEIDHTRRSFALAAGYGGKAHSVASMPELLTHGLDVKGDPLVAMAEETLRDGCLLESFNADIALACRAACKDAVVKDVLDRIAREERSHADLAWAILGWLVERGGERVVDAVRRSGAALERVAVPVPWAGVDAELLAKADPVKLRDHGRIAETEWETIWSSRVVDVRARVTKLLEVVVRAA